jgi:DNA repair photolyase
MEYTFKRKNEVTGGFDIEKVKLERWVWGVIYKDGRELHQFDSNGVYHQFKEIEKENVKLFSMYKPNDMSKRYDIVVTEGMKISHFYRNVKPFYLKKCVRIYVFGWEKDDKIVYHFILPDDRTITSDTNNVDLPQFKLK